MVVSERVCGRGIRVSVRIYELRVRTSVYIIYVGSVHSVRTCPRGEERTKIERVKVEYVW